MLRVLEEQVVERMWVDFVHKQTKIVDHCKIQDMRVSTRPIDMYGRPIDLPGCPCKLLSHLRLPCVCCVNTMHACISYTAFLVTFNS